VPDIGPPRPLHGGGSTGPTFTPPPTPPLCMAAGPRARLMPPGCRPLPLLRFSPTPKRCHREVALGLSFPIITSGPTYVELNDRKLSWASGDR
jgi:hypothetical protein